MLQLKKCKFCGREFRSQSASNSEYCGECSGLRRQLAGEIFQLESGKSLILGNYLLSERQVTRFGLRPR